VLDTKIFLHLICKVSCELCDVHYDMYNGNCAQCFEANHISMMRLARDLSNDELMRKLSDEDISALGELFYRHGAMVRHALARFSPELSETEKDDLVQDVFLSLYKSASRYEERAAFKSWLYKIAVNVSRRWRRDTWLRRRVLSHKQAKINTSAVGITSTPEDRCDARAQVQKALAGLSEKQREITLLHMEGFSGQEIAMMLGIKINAVWTRLHRARRQVEETLSEETRIFAIKDGQP